MFLIQIFIPKYYPDGNPVDDQIFQQIQPALLSRFDGVSAFLQSPIEGKWKDGQGSIDYDEVVMFEVMSDQLDRAWWQNYKITLEKRLSQKRILIRSTEVECL